MTIQQDIFTTLAGYAGLSALVGVRIYPDVAPMSVACPYVVWSEISTTPINGLDGHNGLNNYRVQVIMTALTAISAREVAAQVRAAMAAASLFKSLEIDFGSADFEEGSKVYGARSDFSVWSTN